MLARFLVAIFALAAAPAALADEINPSVDVVCSRSGNIAVIRFGRSVDDGPVSSPTLPHRVDDGLSRAGASGRTDCMLPNGWALRVRSGVGQAFAYGMGGADPPAFFSLWIKRRRIFSAMEWKPGYGEVFNDPPSLVALVVRPDRLTWCRARDGQKPRCTDQRFALGRKYRIDTVEYPPNGRKWKMGTLLVTPVDAQPGFCRRYLVAMRTPMPNGVAFDHALSNNGSAPFAAELPFRPVQNRPDLTQADVEIAPGLHRRILWLHGESHFFDGDVVFVLPQGTDTSTLASEINFRSEAPDHNSDTVRVAVAPGWTKLVGGSRGIYLEVSPRYVHFVPERIDGRLYFLASPTNLKELPTALLIGIRAEGGSRVMCRIQRVEPHF